MEKLQHETCSQRKREIHILFADTEIGCVHNACMDSKVDKVAREMGDRVIRDRKSMGWTQRQLAIQTGWKPEKDDGEQRMVLSPTRISNFEQGTRRIRHEEAGILGRVFNRPTAYYLATISEAEAAVIVAMRQSAA